VVLHLRDDDLVTRAEWQHVRHQVECLGGVLREHDLARVGRTDEGRDLHPGALVQRGRFLGEGVNAPVHIGVVPLVVVALRVQHPQRLLRRGGAVEVDQRHAGADLPFENREVFADDRDVVTQFAVHFS